MAAFARQVTAAPHRNHLLGLVYESLGRLDDASRCFRKSVEANSSDNHDFMSRLTHYWAFLVEHGRVTEAVELLLSASRQVPRAVSHELDDMFRQTLQTAFAKTA